MGEWKEYEISELIQKDKMIIGDGYRAKNTELSKTGIPFARAGNINNGFHFEDADCIPESDLEKIGNKVSQENDIVFTSKGTVGRFGFVKRETQRFVYSPQLCFWRSLDYKLIESRWLYYWMKGREFWEQASSVKDQTDMADYVNLRDQRNMRLTLPPLPEQRAITSVLSSLDDKIDLLHRQNKTLEAMAETLFRQWFVEEADEGWEEGVLGDLIELSYGKALKDESRTGHGYPVVGSNGIVGYHSDYYVEGPGIVIGRKGTLGKVCYLYESFFPIDTTYYVKSKNDSHGLFFEYFLLKTISFEEMNSDSAVPGLNRDIALSSEIKIPPKGLIKEFNSICKHIMNKINKNAQQIRTLEKLRDTLLPKLMSGEVRVEV